MIDLHFKIYNVFINRLNPGKKLNRILGQRVNQTEDFCLTTMFNNKIKNI